MSEFARSAVYFLCFATSAACAILLARNYLRTASRLLLWSALCFLLLALNNLVVILDMIVFPDINFRLLRLVFSLSAVVVVLFGFIWDLDE